MLTPECPEGREVIIIANDITHLIGSFGPVEDQLFKVMYLTVWCEYKGIQEDGSGGASAAPLM